MATYDNENDDDNVDAHWGPINLGWEFCLEFLKFRAHIEKRNSRFPEISDFPEFQISRNFKKIGKKNRKIAPKLMAKKITSKKRAGMILPIGIEKMEDILAKNCLPPCPSHGQQKGPLGQQLLQL